MDIIVVVQRSTDLQYTELGRPWFVQPPNREKEKRENDFGFVFQNRERDLAARLWSGGGQLLHSDPFQRTGKFDSLMRK